MVPVDNEQSTTPENGAAGTPAPKRARARKTAATPPQTGAQTEPAAAPQPKKTRAPRKSAKAVDTEAPAAAAKGTPPRPKRTSRKTAPTPEQPPTSVETPPPAQPRAARKRTTTQPTSEVPPTPHTVRPTAVAPAPAEQRPPAPPVEYQEPQRKEQNERRNERGERRPDDRERGERRPDNRERGERRPDDRERGERRPDDRERGERRPDDRERGERRPDDRERRDNRERGERRPDDRERGERRPDDRERRGERERGERRPDERERGERRPDDRERGERRPDDRERGERRPDDRERRPDDRERGERRPDDRERGERRPDNRERGERRPDDRERGERRPDDRERGERRPDDRERGKRRPDDRERGERRPDDRERGERRPDNRERGERRPDDRERGEHRPDDRERGERRPDDRERGERRPDDRERGERRPDDRERGERRPDDHERGERRPDDRERGERRPDDREHDEQRQGTDEARQTSEPGERRSSRRGRRGGRNRGRNRRQDDRHPDESPESPLPPGDRADDQGEPYSRDDRRPPRHDDDRRMRTSEPQDQTADADGPAALPSEQGDRNTVSDPAGDSEQRERRRGGRGRNRRRDRRPSHDQATDAPLSDDHGATEYRDSDRQEDYREPEDAADRVAEPGSPADERQTDHDDRRGGRGRNRRRGKRRGRQSDTSEHAGDSHDQQPPSDAPSDSRPDDRRSAPPDDRSRKQPEKKQGRQPRQESRQSKPVPPPVEVPTLKELPPVRPVVRPARTKAITLRTSLEKHPELREFYRRLDDELRYRLVVRDEEKIVCAVSGGVDSVVMLDAIVQLASERGYELIVAHFNHKLRSETSDRDEQFVRSLAKHYKLPFFGGQGNVMEYAASNRLSIEVAARELRYRYFEYVMRQTGSTTLALAHTADDVAETMLLNLLRGSGLTGLTGMPARRSLGRKTFVIRPFLRFKKEELRQYATLRSLAWHEDETNTLLQYTRNKVRHHLLPLLQQEYAPSISDTLNRTARLMQGAHELVSQVVNNLMPQVVTESSSGRLLLSAPALASHTPFLQGEILQRAIREHFDMQSVSMDAVERILQLLASESGTRQDISRHICAVRDRENIVLALRTVHNEVELRVEKNNEYTIGDRFFSIREMHKREAKFTDEPNIEFIDAEFLPYRLTLRTWQQGDAFQPLGMKGTMKISDFLTNQKVPVLDKSSVLVLCTESEIVWVCGMRINDKYKVTRTTEKVVRLEIGKRPKP